MIKKFKNNVMLLYSSAHTATPPRTPSHLERDVFYGRPKAKSREQVYSQALSEPLLHGPSKNCLDSPWTTILLRIIPSPISSIASNIIFLIYSEMMMLDAMEEIEEGIKVGRKLVKDVRFADDQGMTAASEGGLQKLTHGLNRTAKEYDMKGNIKVMKVSRKGGGEINITIDGERLEQVDRFGYLQSLHVRIIPTSFSSLLALNLF